MSSWKAPSSTGSLETGGDGADDHDDQRHETDGDEGQPCDLRGPVAAADALAPRTAPAYQVPRLAVRTQRVDPFLTLGRVVRDLGHVLPGDPAHRARPG